MPSIRISTPGKTLSDLAAYVGGVVQGNAECVITGVATLANAIPGDITFLSNPQYRRYLVGTQASAVILSPEDKDACTTTALVVDNPYVAYARIAAWLYAEVEGNVPSGVHPTACIDGHSSIDASASIGPHCVIEAGVEIAAHVVVGAGCFVGKNALIGEKSHLLPNVTLYSGVRLGKRVRIHSGAVIGSDGFGIANDKGVWVKVPQLGSVIIGDDVEIGANTTIDRGALEDTTIEEGVKLDNQIQIGHNVHVGAHTAVAGCVGIAGSARIGKRCSIGGGVGISGHLEIVDDVYITGMTFVTKSIRSPGWYSSGIPADTNQQWHRNVVRFRQLDEMARRLKVVESLIKEMQN